MFQGDRVPSYSGSNCPTSWNTWIFSVVSCFPTHWSLSVNMASEEPLQWLAITECLKVPSLHSCIDFLISVSILGHNSWSKYKFQYMAINSCNNFPSVTGYNRMSKGTHSHNRMSEISQCLAVMDHLLTPLYIYMVMLSIWKPLPIHGHIVHENNRISIHPYWYIAI